MEVAISSLTEQHKIIEVMRNEAFNVSSFYRHVRSYNTSYARILRILLAD